MQCVHQDDDICLVRIGEKRGSLALHEGGADTRRERSNFFFDRFVDRDVGRIAKSLRATEAYEHASQTSPIVDDYWIGPRQQRLHRGDHYLNLRITLSAFGNVRRVRK